MRDSLTVHVCRDQSSIFIWDFKVGEGRSEGQLQQPEHTTHTEMMTERVPVMFVVRFAHLLAQMLVEFLVCLFVCLFVCWLAPGRQGGGDSDPLLHHFRLMSPAAQHLSASQPQRVRRKTARARQQPDIKQHSHRQVRQLLRDTACRQTDRPLRDTQTGRQVSTLIGRFGVSPVVVGGATMAWLMWSRKCSRVSQVSLLITALSLANV